MLFIVKETDKVNMSITQNTTCKTIPELADVMKFEKGEPISVCQITYDGLYALCIKRSISECLKEKDRLNCVFEICTEEFPYSVSIAVSDMVFFRLKNNCSILDFIPSEDYRHTNDINITAYTKYMYLSSVTTKDIETIMTMMSENQQKKLIDVTIAYAENELTSLQRESRIKVPRGISVV